MSNSRWGVTDGSIVDKNKLPIIVDDAVPWMQIAMEGPNPEQIGAVDTEKLQQELLLKQFKMKFQESHYLVILKKMVNTLV